MGEAREFLKRTTLRTARNPSSSGGIFNALSHNATSARWVTRDLHFILFG
jgi:hypothetical protein